MRCRSGSVCWWGTDRKWLDGYRHLQQEAPLSLRPVCRSLLTPHPFSPPAFEGFPKGYGSDFGGSMTDLGENDHLGEAVLSPPAGSTVAHSRSWSWSPSESSGLDLGPVDGFKGCWFFAEIHINKEGGFIKTYCCVRGSTRDHNARTIVSSWLKK